MLTKFISYTIKNFQVVPVDIEVHVLERGFPRFDIVGLATKSITESKFRIRSAFSYCNLPFPKKRILVNLNPVNRTKQHSLFDIPISLGLLRSAMEIRLPEDAVFLGSLHLNGEVTSTFIECMCAEFNKHALIFVPATSYETVCHLYSDKDKVIPFTSIKHLLSVIVSKKVSIINTRISTNTAAVQETPLDDIVGLVSAKRSLEIAIAGGHNLLIMGSPGVGKSILAKSAESLLPPITKEELPDVVKRIAISTSDMPQHVGECKRPFVRVPQKITVRNLLYGSNNENLGLINLAHTGVLYMDEFAEYESGVLDSLKQPLDDLKVVKPTEYENITVESRFILIATANPCRCGNYTNQRAKCTCTPHQIAAYRRKFMGPLLDRIPLVTDILPEFDSNIFNDTNFTHLAVQNRINRARNQQYNRYKGPILNGHLPYSLFDKFLLLEPGATTVINKARVLYNFSTRQYFNTLRVARTIADLSNDVLVKDVHAEEALYNRFREV